MWHRPCAEFPFLWIFSQNLLHDSFWYSRPFCYVSAQRPVIFLQNIGYTSNVFACSCYCWSSASLLITNQLSSFWNCIVPMKHGSTMYWRLTINFLNHSNVFVALKSPFQQKQITARCSTVFSITIYDADKIDKLRLVANMHLTANGSSWNLAYAENRVYWQTSPSFMEMALLILLVRIVVAKLTGQTLY